MRLSVRHAPIGKQHDDTHPGSLVEGSSDGSAGITRRCNENRQRRRLITFETREAGGQEACTNVLECGSRPMIELEQRGVALRGR